MNINSSTFHSSIIIKTPYSLFFIKEVYFLCKAKGLCPFKASRVSCGAWAA